MLCTCVSPWQWQAAHSAITSSEYLRSDLALFVLRTVNDFPSNLGRDSGALRETVQSCNQIDGNIFSDWWDNPL